MTLHKSHPRVAIALLMLLCSACSDAEPSDVRDLDSGALLDGGADAGRHLRAHIETRVISAALERSMPKLRGGAASGGELESLRYHVRSIRICESLDTQGSGFSNARGCLDLYRGDESRLQYQPGDDYRPLAAAARASDTGFIDLMNAGSRAQLSQEVALTNEHVRSYHYGIVTWALPIKVRASAQLSGGPRLYTHDGEASYETVGADAFRSYFTDVTTPLDRAPAEDVIVLLPNGGNWFKFQSPLIIDDEDISSGAEFLLDLVFNPDGIIKVFEGEGLRVNVRGPSAAGGSQGFTVPMLDLAPVPHRASERVVRESYQGELVLGDNAFDVRLELYLIDGDVTETVYGVDLKSIVTSRTKAIPPEMMKIAYVERNDDGSLTLMSFSRAPIVTELRRGASTSASAQLVCGTHADRTAAQGGAAIVVDSCPARAMEVEFTQVARTLVEGSVPVGVRDAGAETSATVADASARSLDAGQE
jgi:hypothetical protein